MFIIHCEVQAIFFSVAPHRGEYSYPPDDDEDIVADARRKPTFSRVYISYVISL